MATTTKTRRNVLDEIEEAIQQITIKDLRDGANDYAFVRVWPDGSVTSGREASYCVPESEYFARGEHPVTVWSSMGLRESTGPYDGVFEWDEIQEVPIDAEFREEGGTVFIEHPDADGEPLRISGFVSEGIIYRLSDRLVEPLDLSDVLAEVDTMLDDYEWLPTD